jgi:hypothetical protein
MTTVANTVTTEVGSGDGSLLLSTWTHLTSTNTDGQPITGAEWADRTWQAQGTWGGATLTFQGSNDKTNWFSLTNAAGGAAATLTANGGLATIELPLWVRPNLTTAGAGADITVTLLMRRAQPLRV